MSPAQLLFFVGTNAGLMLWVYVERRARLNAERRAFASKHVAETYMRDVKENGDRYADEIKRLRGIIDNYRVRLAKMRDNSPTGVRHDINDLLRGEDSASANKDSD